MIKSKYFRLFTGIAFGALLMWVTTSCEGPMGPDGKNGQDGINGTDANSSCLKCHTTANMNVKTSEYHLSKHFLGTSSARNTKYCARCHTNEGFKEITSNEKFVCAAEIPNATRINCETCHAHTNFDFSADTASDILRTITPIALNYNNNATYTDFGKINNLCVTCHQIRGVTLENVYNATKNASGVYVVNTSADKNFKQLPYFPFNHINPITKASYTDNDSVQYKVGVNFSVHDGNQSNLFAGINAYEYTGKTYTRTWKHSSNSCTDCHMNKYNPADSTGGHTLKPNEAECAKCHTSDHVASTQSLISAKLIELRDLLVAKKIFKKTTSASGSVSYAAVPTHDYNGKVLGSAVDTFAISLTSSNTFGAGTGSAATGLITYRSDVTYGKDATASSSTIGAADRLRRQWTYGEMGAAYNYGYINSELSLGVHNPTYALQVLQTSIDYLNAH